MNEGGNNFGSVMSLSYISLSRTGSRITVDFVLHPKMHPSRVLFRMKSTVTSLNPLFCGRFHTADRCIACRLQALAPLQGCIGNLPSRKGLLRISRFLVVMAAKKDMQMRFNISSLLRDENSLELERIRKDYEMKVA